MQAVFGIVILIVLILAVAVISKRRTEGRFQQYELDSRRGDEKEAARIHFKLESVRSGRQGMEALERCKRIREMVERDKMAPPPNS